MAQIFINGEAHEVPEGQMLIEATDALGIDVPRFCYHRGLSVAANCRMCLVEVANRKTPAPACATPVSEGMEVQTHSEGALEARRAIMEFLLINHPLDCPICDQGGECDLQDFALAHGSGHSRYREPKRAVADEDLGPLIETEMTRCIHCTRCVRFGEEVGGYAELGATFRGEEMEIGTYVGRTVESELSGNMIDLCPVGALTSKPYRYKARVWEMRHHPTICPHCPVGCNMKVEEVDDEVKRVLPVTNDAINEDWICDKGRYSYEAVHHDRVAEPHIKVGDRWRAVSWETAFNAALKGLRSVGSDLAAAVAPTATVEEQWLTQHLVRGLGATDIDHRLGLADPDLDAGVANATPLLGQRLVDLEALDGALVIGGNPRKDQPLANHRLRKAVARGARVSALGPVRYPRNLDHFRDLVHGPGQAAPAVAAVAKAVAEAGGAGVPANLQGADAEEAGLDPREVQELADSLIHGRQTSVLVGTLAQEDPQAGELIRLAHQAARLAGAAFGYLAAYGNSVGAWATGCVPHRGPGGDPVREGRPAAAFLASDPRRGILTLGCDPLVEAADPVAAQAAFEAAELHVAITSHWSATARAADVVLPMAAYPENEGAYASGEGRLQAFGPAASPVGEARPAWKILRVLAHTLGVPESEFVEVGEIRERAEAALTRAGIALGASPPEPGPALEAEPRSGPGLLRVPARHIYHDDLFVRRAPALQEQFGRLTATISPEDAAERGVDEGDAVRFEGPGGSARLPVHLDGGVPPGVAWIPAGEDAASLGPAFGWVRLSDRAAGRTGEAVTADPSEA